MYPHALKNCFEKPSFIKVFKKLKTSEVETLGLCHGSLCRARWMIPSCHCKSYVCPSVRLSVTFKYRYHVGWNTCTSKMISRRISLRLLLGLTPTWASWSNGNTPKLGWNGDRVVSTKTCNISEIGARYDPGYYDGLIGSRIRVFNWHQNQCPWMTLNGRNATLAEI